MQSKGLITGLAVILILVSAYQLIFTWKVNKVEGKARTYAQALVPDENPEQIRLYKNQYLDSIANETVFNLGFKKFTYNDCKKQQLNLGLDLQGGMSVVMQVNLKEFLVSVSDDNEDETFRAALDAAEQEHINTGSDFIDLFISNYKKLHPDGNDARLAPVFTSRDYQDKIPFEATNEEVEKVLRSESIEAINRTYSIISSRIDQFGVTQPNIQLEEKRGRIVVELAGVDNPKRVRKLLQSTANLELWETYKVAEVGDILGEINDIIAEELELAAALDSTVNDEFTEDGVEDVVEEVIDDEEESLEDLLSELEEAPDSASEEFEEFEDSTAAALTDAEQEKLYPLWTKLSLSIDRENNTYYDSPGIGFAQIKDTAQIMKYLRMDKVQDRIPETMKFRWSYKPEQEGSNFLTLYAVKTARGQETPIMDGSTITDADADLDQYGRWVVNMEMNNEGSKVWADFTGDHFGTKGVDDGDFVAVLVDDGVVSAPRIQDKIEGGKTQISGAFEQEEAADLASMLKIGKLPARAEIVEEEVVGPTLGKANIRSGLFSLLWGFMLVIGFMVLYYAGAGIVAVIVLLVNLFLIIGVLASFNATLTLPGIAGLVLTIGMAVDANVIIFERIREELHKGKPLRAAIADGYKYSASAIIDANITTLLTALILNAVGKGPIKGFAFILIIGIVTSVFTAVLVARVMIESYLGRGKDKTIAFSTPFSKDRFKNLNFDFLGARKKAYIVSSTIVLAGLISMFAFKPGFDMGVDFKGGREYIVEFDDAVNTSDLKDVLDDAAIFDGGTVVKTFGSARKVKVTTDHKIELPGEEVDNEVEHTLFTGLKTYIPDLPEVDEEAFKMFKENHLLSSTEINPLISTDFKRSAVWATILSIGAIFLYILIRFSNIGRGRMKTEYAVGAVVTIAHDVLVLLGIFSLFKSIMPFSLEINQAFIAALLTVIGYSLNDTVVVFDRIREYLGLHPKRDKAEVINQAVNDTLSRTLITSLTTLFVVAILFVFGGSVIKGFAFALLIGIFVGTYSSVFVATPIMYDMSKGKDVKVVSSRNKRQSAKSRKKGKKAGV